MQSTSETSDFSGVDFAGIRGLDPGGLYQVINIRNQEFIDHTFLGHVEIQETDVMSTGTSVANGFQHTNVIVNQRKDLATLTPISDDWSVRQENLVESLHPLPPLAIIQQDKNVEEVPEKLPHKKRLPRKKESVKVKNPETVIPEEASAALFTCQLCSRKSSEQFSFYSHLKTHYESRPKVRSVAVQVDPEDREKCQEVVVKSEDPEKSSALLGLEEEFSDPEDMLEGIRGVVDKVQEQSGEEETHQDGLDIYGKDWYSQESLNVPEGLEQHENLQGVPENFVLYINKNVLENSVFSAQIHQTAIEKALMESMQELKEPPEAENKEPEVQKTRKRKTRQSANPTQEVQVKERLRKRKIKEEVEEESPSDGVKKVWKKPSKCDVCQREFNSRNALRYHILSHTGQRPHQCEVCGKAFYSSSALKVHKRLHTGVRPYSCKHCGRMFRQWGDLKYHITSKHSEEKNHQCEFCGKDFARRYSLVIHRRIHTGERNYSCDYCSKSFRASSYLQNHRKIHTGEKPYTCTICAKKFRVRGDMKRHMNTHYPKTEGKEKAAKGKKKQKKKPEDESPQEILPTVPPPANQEGEVIKMELGSVTYEIHNLPSDEEATEAAEASRSDSFIFNFNGQVLYIYLRLSIITHVKKL